MTKIAQKAEFISRMGMFRPSDRSALKKALIDESRSLIAIEAVKEFVREWEKADWLEAYSLERIGKWIAKNDPNTAEKLSTWAKTKKNPARTAFLKGLEARVTDLASV